METGEIEERLYTKAEVEKILEYHLTLLGEKMTKMLEMYNKESDESYNNLVKEITGKEPC